ncbi:MAG: DinB family protein [Acidobacteriota bacterium]
MPHAAPDAVARSGFPNIYASLAAGTLLEAYGAAADRVTRALDGLTESELRAHPIPAKWSIHEIVLHLADSETVGAVRFRKVVSESFPDLPAYDEKAWAVSFGYGDRDASFRRAALHTFRNLRETALALFQTASPSDWKRQGRHSEWGPVTLRELLELYADHGERHLEQIVARRRLLGRPGEPAPLLPVRLY